MLVKGAPGDTREQGISMYGIDFVCLDPMTCRIKCDVNVWWYIYSYILHLHSCWKTATRGSGNRQAWYLHGYTGIFWVKQYSSLCCELPWHNPNWLIICRRYQTFERLRAKLGTVLLWLYQEHLTMNVWGNSPGPRIVANVLAAVAI